MSLPRIDLANLPELPGPDAVTAGFGSLASPAQLNGHEDALVVVMVFIYDLLQWL